MNAKRGYVPEDERNFSTSALETMRIASRHIQIRKDVDRELYGKENVITSDSVILDNCKSWINLTPRCLEKLGKEALKVW